MAAQLPLQSQLRPTVLRLQKNNDQEYQTSEIISSGISKYQTRAHPNVRQVECHIIASSHKSCKDPGTTARALLSYEIHLVPIPVVDPQLGHRLGCFGDEFAIANAPGVGKELFLEVLGDPLLDDNVVAIALLYRGISIVLFLEDYMGIYTHIIPVPRQMVSHQSLREEVSAMDLKKNVRTIGLNG